MKNTPPFLEETDPVCADCGRSFYDQDGTEPDLCPKCNEAASAAIVTAATGSNDSRRAIALCVLSGQIS